MDSLVCRVCLVAVLAAGVHPSAIPMWEFLSRAEKVRVTSDVIDYVYGLIYCSCFVTFAVSGGPGVSAI